ncbi:MAG: hypothetical protein P8163_05660 [Candidatus Thiodiazotropha sp.]
MSGAGWFHYLNHQEDSTMGSGLWFITILKEQPWIGLVLGIILFLLLFLVKKWLVAKLMNSEGES